MKDSQYPEGEIARDPEVVSTFPSPPEMRLQDREDQTSGPRAVYTGALIYGPDGTIAADIQSSVIDQSDNVESLTWIGTAFPLGSVCAILPSAALYAIFDLKTLFITSVLLFEAASALCGAAPTMNALIVGIGAVWGTGAVLGPVVGGAFSTSSATWRWAFYINLVIAALCAPVYIFYLPRAKPAGSAETPALKKLRALDWTGFIDSTGAVVSLTMVLTFAGSTWGWSNGRTIATFVVSGILLNINPAMAATNIYVPVYYIPIYFAFTHGDSAMMAAVRLLPCICFLASLNMASGILLPSINYYWVMYLVGGILMKIGSATMYTVKPSTPMANVYGYSIVLGAGTGLVFNLGFTVASVTTMTKTGSSLDVQHVLSMQNLSQLGFQTMSLLIGGQIFQSLSMRNLTQVFDGLGFSQADIRNAITGSQSTLFTSLNPSIQEQAITAVTSAMSQVYVLSIAASAITVIDAILMKKERLFPAAAGKTVVAGGV
ncbi:putative MFS drug efflux transporter protein [Seiridium cardinale]|uniref:MFS drug efflux transporter protein n=1 Tax=Seiridium cardinale TaxID=138064 RepID=A0ABR2XUR7_9PEZI